MVRPIMEPERWERVAELYEAASRLGADGRSAFLAEECRGDDEVRREVESLLGQKVSQFGVLERVAEGVSEDAGRQRIPAAIGRYRVLSLLGEGGMGAVYEAEQDHPRRKVALKIIKPGLASGELLRRFEQELQTLGRLQHPGIAQIYDAGAADTGFGPQPYFAMEFIAGLPLLEYANAHAPDTRQRLELMVRVCEAVDHAHQRGVIHRDLKPGNILVDESGQPKVLDFGIARVIDSDATATRQTDLGKAMGTLAYMSPEQVGGDWLDLDARSDVYALGVLLYELLAGRLPYEVTGRVLEAARIIRDEDATPLGRVSRTFRGDLETIAAKALEKDKERRYGSAAELAADLSRYLANEPIQARPPSTGYHVRKFARRHQALVSTVTAAFVVLLAGILASTWQAVRAGRAEREAVRERDRATGAERSATTERDRALKAEQAANSERNRAVEESKRADTEAATAKAVNDFLQHDLLAQAGSSAQAGPNNKPDPDLKVRAALDRAAGQIAGKFDSQPAVEASIRLTIGTTYQDLGLYAQAEAQLDRALELRRRVLGPQHADTMSIMSRLADLYQLQGKYKQATPLFTQVLEWNRRLHGSDHPETLAAMSSLGWLAGRAEGDHARAVELYTKVLAVQRRVLGEEHPDTLAVMNNLASTYVSYGDYEASARLLRKVVEVKTRVMGEEHPSTLISMNTLAVAYRFQGKYADAEPLLIHALATRRRTMGEQHPSTLASMNSLGNLYQAQAKYAQAEQLLNEVLDGYRRTIGEEHPDALSTMHNMADLYRRMGRPEEAESGFQKVLAARRRLLGPQHPNSTITLAALGGLKLEQKQYAGAEEILRQALTDQQKTSPESWRRYYTEGMLGASIGSLGKHAEAEPLLISAYDGLVKRRVSIPSENRAVVEEVQGWIVGLYQEWGKPDAAAVWRAKRL